ncbi:hypothetical protein NP233_g2023 [Leucocoprinus birnbaumii]|uniref:Uncharacterized protein n=1 Tax=Leucocoprinus birnbaumii TaxID=56174 RepID=A0AAD5VYZ5_9AGAR|nr:hypothetical protein NP233_g2023 [Leucocoprinus birnbaumii]
MRSSFALFVALTLISGVACAPAPTTLEPQNFAIIGNPTPDHHDRSLNNDQNGQPENFRMSGNPTKDSLKRWN